MKVDKFDREPKKLITLYIAHMTSPSRYEKHISGKEDIQLPRFIDFQTLEPCISYMPYSLSFDVACPDKTCITHGAKSMVPLMKAFASLSIIALNHLPPIFLRTHAADTVKANGSILTGFLRSTLSLPSKHQRFRYFTTRP